MEWIELVLPGGELADEIAALIAETAEAAAAGVEVRGEDIVVWAPAPEAEAARASLAAAVARLRDEGFAVDPDAIHTRPGAPEDEWRDAWKRYFHVRRISSRIVIVPSWETFAPGPGDIVLDLDPGRAFGTGAHASTRLCLVELERLAESLAVKRFADVGTGSGILAITAAKLWPASTGIGVDVDPLSVECAAENLQRNGIGDRVVTSGATLDASAERFDLVLANIQADVLEALAPSLAAHVAPGGALVLAGLLAPQAEPVAAIFVAHGLVIDRIHQLPEDLDWSSVVLRRP
jgi:ribosomal protein L11 methyltransferase